MAIADLTRAMSVDAPSEDALLDEGDLRLEVHDASRLEWCVSIPLADDRPRKYAIRLELEIAANVFARHSPWDQLQSWTRLDGPAEQIAVGARVTIDGLRRATISLAHKLARVADGFVRHCRLAGALSSMAPRDELIAGLSLWLGTATSTAEDARARLVATSADDTADITRERALIDEYVSVRLLEMLASAERALGALAASRQAETYAQEIAEAEIAVGEALGKELEHRQRSEERRV